MINNRRRTFQRIGIYSGTFNPVHAGHISFALQAIDAANLHAVYFMPERHNRKKTDVAHFGHRVAMLKAALKPHARLDLLETEDISFSVERTLPKLQARFKGKRLVFLIGSDKLRDIGSWPKAEYLLDGYELVVGIRSKDRNHIDQLLQDLPQKPHSVCLIDSYAGSVSSSKIRDALRRQQETEGILASVKRYSNQNWLYISLVV